MIDPTPPPPLRVVSVEKIETSRQTLPQSFLSFHSWQSYGQQPCLSVADTPLFPPEIIISEIYENSPR